MATAKKNATNENYFQLFKGDKFSCVTKWKDFPAGFFAANIHFLFLQLSC